MHWDKQRTNAQRPMPKAPAQILAQEQKFLNTLSQKLVSKNFFDSEKILKDPKNQKPNAKTQEPQNPKTPKTETQEQASSTRNPEPKTQTPTPQPPNTQDPNPRPRTQDPHTVCLVLGARSWGLSLGCCVLGRGSWVVGFGPLVWGALGLWFWGLDLEFLDLGSSV